MPPKFVRLCARVLQHVRLLAIVFAFLFSFVIPASARELHTRSKTKLLLQSGHIYLSASLPSGTVGTAYSGALSTRGGAAPYTFSLTGTLPPGVTMNTATGAFSGTPSKAGTFYFAVYVSDSLGDRGDKKLSISVASAPTSTSQITVQISPVSSTVASGKSQQFAATVSGTSNTAVVWYTTAGTISSTGLLTAPSVSTNTSLSVRAKSAVTDASASATVTVTAPVTSSIAPTVSVSVNPGSTTVQMQGSVQFTASVSGSTNTAVTWTAGLGSISASGLYTAPSSSGTDTIIATSQADPTKAASASVTIQAAQTPSSSSGGSTSTVTAVDDNAYCSPSETWQGPATDGVASLPVRCMYTPVSATPSPGAVHGPDSTTAAVQTDLNGAACGDTILVAAGSTLGPLVLPAKGCDNAHWITLKSTGVSNANFPAEGVRMTPCSSGIASMPNRPAYPCPSPQVLTFKIVTPGSSNGIVAAGGDHYRIIGAEITRVPTGGVPIYNLVDLSSRGTQTNNIIFDRVWFHGINQDGNFPMTSQSMDTSTTRAIYLGQSNHVAVIDSYFSDFYDTSSMSANGNTDSQCIGGGVGGIANSGWGVYKFVNNHCEASGEGILLGGSAGPPLTPSGCTVMVNCNLDVPTDIEVRENYFFKPLSWDGTASGGGSGWPVVKNGFEMKIGARALFEGNVIENTWYQAQVGWCWSVAPKNQAGGSTSVGTAPTALTNDFTYRYNYCYHTAYGLGVYQSMDLNCTSCQAQGANRIMIHDNLIGDALTLGICPPLCGAGDELAITAAPDSTNRGLNKLQNVNISHNTFVKGVRALLGFGASSSGQIINFTYQNNLGSNASYGVIPNPSTGGCDGSGGASFYYLLTNCVTGWTADHNAVFNWGSGTLGGGWPTTGSGSGNFFFTGTSSVGFTNYGTGDSGFNPGNYALTSSSPLSNAASDGTDLGADVATLLTKIAGVRR